MNRNRVIVTGANGLLGKALTKRLLYYEYEVFGLVRKSQHSINLENYHEIEFDLLADFNSEKLPKNIDTIVHLAQSPEFKNFPTSANDVFSVNTISTIKLLDYSRLNNVKKFIYASSGAIYQNSNNLISEESKIIEIGSANFYAITKLASEYLIGSYKEFMTTSILRFFFIYGPGQDSKMLFPTLASKVRDGRPITLNGPEGIRINPIHVLDAANKVHKFIESDLEGTFNISGRQSASIREICDLMGAALEVEAIYDVREAAMNLETQTSPDNFNYSDQEFTLTEGIQDFLRGR
jgi:nucleoside-diphosphate-sugar epimerase